MKIHVLQHVAFEGPAAIADWASMRGHALSSTHYFAKGWQHPDLADFDLLVIMGGPMGVGDTSEYSWLQPEMDFVKSVLHAGKKVLGVCLGAQIMAHVLGGKVTRNPLREIGWFPVQSNSDWFPKEFIAFHWHGETFSIPPNATPLCSSVACANQAFLWEGRAIGLQFHLETTEASAEALVTHAAADLSNPGEWVQDAGQIRKGSQEHSARLNRHLFQLLDRWSADSVN